MQFTGCVESVCGGFIKLKVQPWWSLSILQSNFSTKGPWKVTRHSTTTQHRKEYTTQHLIKLGHEFHHNSRHSQRLATYEFLDMTLKILKADSHCHNVYCFVTEDQSKVTYTLSL